MTAPPLTVLGYEPLPELDSDPACPNALRGFETEWRRMPLAKRRLATLGPTQGGHLDAVRAASILSAECRAQGIPLTAVEQLVKEMPLTGLNQPERRVRRQLPGGIRWGFFPRDGVPVLTGCPRDPRRRPERPEKTGFRQDLAPYCDQACGETCCILRAIRHPARCLAESEYAHMDVSDLWVQGGIGHAAHEAWRQLALQALATPDKTVAATATFLARANPSYSLSTYRRALKALDEHGLAVVIAQKAQVRQRVIRVLSADELRQLEQGLGVRGQRKRNLREAVASGDAYKRFQDERLTELEKIAAWTAT